MTEPDIYNLPEAAAALRVSPRTLTRRLNDGTIKSFWFGGRRLIRRADLEAAIQRLSDAPDEGNDLGAGRG